MARFHTVKEQGFEMRWAFLKMEALKMTNDVEMPLNELINKLLLHKSFKYEYIAVLVSLTQIYSRLDQDQWVRVVSRSIRTSLFLT